MIAAQSALGVKRQIFFCASGGFDTHADQLPQQVQLLSTVSQSMSAFYQATQELGVANQVTTFSLSEFSRTLEPGSNGGSDHAWGGHQLILGGAVKGNAIYGTYPTLALGGPDAGDLVWSQCGEPAVHFPELGEFSDQQSGVHGLAA